MFLKYLLIIILSYLIGSIPVGFIAGKLNGVDIRKLGSKNIGATNVYRILGVWPAFFVFLGDALKGIAGVCLGQVILGMPLAALAGGVFAIVGHNWPVFLMFKGGRGVATGLGVILIISPWATLVVFLVWAAIVYFTRYVSLASIIAAILTPISIWAFNYGIEFVAFGWLAAIFVIFRHKPNIERLLRGEELKIKFGGKQIKKR